jgi:ATP-dependent Zn protease
MSKPRSPKLAGLREERTAYHEAGHAVVAHFLNRRTVRVSIRPNGELAC